MKPRGARARLPVERERGRALDGDVLAPRDLARGAALVELREDDGERALATDERDLDARGETDARRAAFDRVGARDRRELRVRRRGVDAHRVERDPAVLQREQRVAPVRVGRAAVADRRHGAARAGGDLRERELERGAQGDSSSSREATRW